MSPRLFRRLSMLVALALLAACWSHAGLVAVAQDLRPKVAADRDKPGVLANWKWLHESATAFLVLEPPPLKGVGRWAIESPRHRGAIYALAVSPDGTRAATGGADGVIRIWNLETGTLEKAFVSHRFHLYKLVWSPDGRKLASHGWGGAKTRVWDVETGKQLLETKSIGNLTALAFSPDSRHLAAGNYGSGHVYVSSNLADYKLLTEMGTTVTLIEWFPDGERLAVVYQGGQTAVRNASDGSRAFDLDHPVDEPPVSIAWSPDGKQMATASAKALTTWKTADGAQVHRIDAQQPFSGVAWSPDGKRLLAATAAGSRFFTAADGKPAGNHPANARIEWVAKTDTIVSLDPARVDVWAVDGKNKVSIDAGGTVAPIFQAGKPIVTGVGQAALTTWNPKTLERIHRLEGHAKPVTAATWSKDGKNFASAAADGSVILWDVAAGKQLHALTGHKAAVTQLAWSPRSDLLASAGPDKTVRLWKEDGSAGPVLEGHAAGVTALAWSPSGKQLVSGDGTGTLIVWDVSSGKQERTVGGTVGVTCLDWATVMNTPAIACGLGNGGIRVFDASTGAEIAVVSAEHMWGAATQAIAWMPGPKPRLVTSRYYLTELWDVAAGDTVARQIAPGGATTVGPTAGGSLALARANDRTVRFWDPSGNSMRGVLLDEEGSLAAILTTGDVAFHKDSPPKLIAVVETESGQQTVSLDELKKTFGWKNNGKMLKLPTKN